MTKKEIIDYIMETPQNTNTAILSQMLDEFAGEGGESMEPLIVQMSWNEEENITRGDKTFGEIRTAFESSRMVYIKWWNRDDNSIGNDLNIITRISYEIYNGGCYASISNGNSTISVETHKDGLPIATLEELDESYIYVSD